MAKYSIEYVIGTRFAVIIEAPSSSMAVEIFETRYEDEQGELAGARELGVEHNIAFVGHA